MAETKYAPVEGEALAIARSLEQTKYFTQGCIKLTVITDHKPLVGLFEKTTLDEITNPRLFGLKQRTMLWRFKTEHRPERKYFCGAIVSISAVRSVAGRLLLRRR